MITSEHTPFISSNPATGQVLQQISQHSGREVERRLKLAMAAFQEYRRTPMELRMRLLLRAAELLENQKRHLGRLMTLEMGKPIRSAIQEAEKCAAGCRYYSENAARFLADETISTGPARTFVKYQPLGPVLAIMPWNFPFWQVFRFAAPALAAGNVGLLKHASNVPQCALAIEGLLRDAGFPEGVFQTLMMESGRVAGVIRDPRITAVTLTGSVEAGRRVAAVASEQIKKTVLELGGSDPFIVMPSADLEQAAGVAVQARVINNGQSCIAAKRFIVHQDVLGEFERRFVRLMSELIVGDPIEETTDVGPLATAEVQEGLEAQVQQTIALGARVLLGGKRLNRPGHFFEPTVLTGIPRNSPAHEEELFGPVASIYGVSGLEEAIALANETAFGLGASAWTNDPREREALIDGLEAGLVFINGMVASDPRLPFGGVKRSGYGRELSHHGLREFVNIKTVSIHEAPAAPQTE